MAAGYRHWAGLAWGFAASAELTAAAAGWPVSGRAGASRPARALASARAAQLPSAGPYPSLNACVQVYDPWPANTATTSATPNAPPSWRSMVKVPQRLADVLRGDVAQHRALRCRERGHGPQADEDQWHCQLPVGKIGPGGQREPGGSGGHEQRAAGDERPLPRAPNARPGSGAATTAAAPHGMSRNPASSHYIVTRVGAADPRLP